VTAELKFLKHHGITSLWDRDQGYFRKGRIE